LAPFRITPASKPGAGANDHWEGAASYGNSHGSEWFEFNWKEDKSYNDPDIRHALPTYIASESAYNENEIGSEEDFFTQGFMWRITNKWENSYTYNKRKYTTYFFSLERTEPGAHHAIFFDHWDVYTYAFLEWHYVREVIRNA
jgi:hypothetical protein